MTWRLIRCATVGGAALLGACAAPAPVLRPGSEVFHPGAIERLLQAAPVAADADLLAQTLTVSGEFSAHLLQFRTGEKRHVHRAHDLTFIAYRGKGQVMVGDFRVSLAPGSVVHIPRGTPHYASNLGEEPLVAVLIFTPPYDMKDSVPLPIEDRSYERE